ncbi:MAG: LysR family transcriptional regulator [Clostridiales bacterium]|nr:LysR family transcriptional regulator [Clostridiales bacterium]
MDNKHLRTFVSVASHCSFTEASRELFIAQSAVSKQIQALEEELGIQLFIRDNRFVRLTAAGEIFHREAVGILEKIDDAVDRIHRLSKDISGTLNLGTFSIILTDLTALVRGFCVKYPNTQVSIDWYEFNHLIPNIENGNLDMGFTIAFQLMDKPALDYITLKKGTLFAAFSKEHPLAGRNELRLSDLKDMPFFTMNPQIAPNGYRAMQFFMKEQGFEPEVWRYHPSHESMLLQLQVHDAYSLLADHQFGGHPGLAFVPLAAEEQPSGNGFDLVGVYNPKNRNPCLSFFKKVCTESRGDDTGME